MEVLILGAICLYSVSACIWVAWKGLKNDIMLVRVVMVKIPSELFYDH